MDGQTACIDVTSEATNPLEMRLDIDKLFYCILISIWLQRLLRMEALAALEILTALVIAIINSNIFKYLSSQITKYLRLLTVHNLKY